MMNCDQAFDLMTNPMLDDSPALHEHLDGCPRCQQMYETLSPALGLFSPVERARGMSDDDREAQVASSIEVAEQVAVSLSQVDQRSDRFRRPQRRWLPIYLAAALVSFTTCLGLVVVFSEPSLPTSLEAADCTWINREANTAKEQPSEAVVKSCLACHVADSTKTSDTSRPNPGFAVLTGLIN